MGRGLHNKPDKKLFKGDDTTHIGKIRDWLVSGQAKELAPTLQQTYERFRFACSCVIDEFMTQREATSAIEKKYELSNSQAARILKDSQKLFGEFLEIDKKFAKAALHEYYTRLLKKCIEANNLELEQKTLDSMAKLHGLTREEVQRREELGEMPKVLLITTNPDVLMKPLDTVYYDAEVDE